MPISNFKAEHLAYLNATLQKSSLGPGKWHQPVGRSDCCFWLFLLEWLKTADNGDNQNEVKYCKDAGFTPRLVANGWIQLSWCLAHSSSIPSLLGFCYFVLNLAFPPGSRNSHPLTLPTLPNMNSVADLLPPKAMPFVPRAFFVPWFAWLWYPWPLPTRAFERLGDLGAPIKICQLSQEMGPPIRFKLGPNISAGKSLSSLGSHSTRSNC